MWRGDERMSRAAQREMGRGRRLLSLPRDYLGNCQATILAGVQPVLTRDKSVELSPGVIA